VTGLVYCTLLLHLPHAAVGPLMTVMLVFEMYCLRFKTFFSKYVRYKPSLVHYE
jgi:hypothetical protein